MHPTTDTDLPTDLPTAVLQIAQDVIEIAHDVSERQAQHAAILADLSERQAQHAAILADLENRAKRRIENGGAR